MHVRYTIADSALGSILVAATHRGMCRLSFDEDEAGLQRRFRGASLDRDDAVMQEYAQLARDAVDCARPFDGDLDLHGTPFQRAVWEELRRIPAGRTRTYADIAVAIGAPGAVRAVGCANGANPVAVIVPCHRVIRSDGGLGGYAYGLERKRRLLDRECERMTLF